MPLIFFRGLAALGLILISGGVVNKNHRRQNTLFLAGGLCLLAYSAYLRDPIFIPLQVIFTSASIYELVRKPRT
ncbi:MAG: hypothetical protein UY92_C0004G0082 [Candidatus Magasanikbacteria bacterium GW2011_GWA2_56_11]|uniref:Uncharacterized protein n=1 Tax=Candidatus Magasanikbacteria bacterium GW2011_GWA2_56_11 TaxID=1619044 RepID=A0A0G1YHN6_9BACT|nr:MAG: hypothetical protein UY92_C0004G0082 [Candidatus Magasanikbacteria bacterium GW2011_GWA2_56_11]